MAVNHFVCQLARRFGWAASAYHEMDGANPHPSACKHSLQYDGRPDGHFVVRVGTWNLSSLCGKGKVCLEPRKRMINI